jgi:hypothetical protein
MRLSRQVRPLLICVCTLSAPPRRPLVRTAPVHGTRRPSRRPHQLRGPQAVRLGYICRFAGHCSTQAIGTIRATGSHPAQLTRWCARWLPRFLHRARTPSAIECTDYARPQWRPARVSAALCWSTSAGSGAPSVAVAAGQMSTTAPAEPASALSRGVFRREPRFRSSPLARARPVATPHRVQRRLKSQERSFRGSHHAQPDFTISNYCICQFTGVNTSYAISAKLTCTSRGVRARLALGLRLGRWCHCHFLGGGAARRTWVGQLSVGVV